MADCPHQRRLTRRERELVFDALTQCSVAPASICRSAVRASLLVRQTPTLAHIRGPRSAVAYAALKTRARAITLGDRIYLCSDVFGGASATPLRVLAHEVAHVAQFRRDGTARFLIAYLASYVRGLVSGLPERRAYRSIPYEREARRVAETVAGPPDTDAGG